MEDALPDRPTMPDDGTVESGESAGDLDALIQSTAGTQPWRRFVHAATGLTVAGALHFLDLPRTVALAVLTFAFVALLALDLFRLRIPEVNRLFFTVFRRVASPREARDVASSTWYALGLIIAVALFPREAAISGILVLAAADPCASYAGQRWGRHPFLGGSVEGTGIFLAVSLAILAARHAWPVALGTGLIATLAERTPWALDDNVVVPAASAATITLLSVLL